jgi:hypothetical protein
MRKAPSATYLAAVLALAAGACGSDRAVYGHFPWRDGNPGLRNVDLTVGSDDLEGHLAVSVVLSGNHAGRDGGCLVVDSGWQVSVDGIPLERRYAGGEARPTMISGVALQISKCANPWFRSRAGARFERRPTSLVVVEEGQRRGSMTVRLLFTPRGLRVLPSSQLRPGERVTLEWQPLSDRWVGYDLSTTAALHRPGEEDVNIARSQLTIDPPRFSFVLPEVHPGPATIRLSTLYLEALPEIVACTGLASCYGSVSVSGAGGAQVTILPR